MRHSIRMTLYVAEPPVSARGDHALDRASSARPALATPPIHTVDGRGLTAVIAPDRGAKIISLRDKRSGREWLAQPAGRVTTGGSYGVPYSDTAMHGWDEALPSISPCAAPGNEGITIPDHGELWSRPWRVTERDSSRLTTEIDGVVLPYQLSRTVSIVDTATLRLDYALTAFGNTPLSLLWAAHPLLTVRPGTKIVLPSAVSRMLDVSTDPNRPALVEWPGDVLDQVRLLPSGSYQKFYVEPDIAPSWAAVVDANGSWIRLDWNPAEVPYLGIGLDAGRYAAEPVVSLGPTTGFYDDLSRAVALGRAARIAPGAVRRWSITVSVGAEDPSVD